MSPQLLSRSSQYLQVFHREDLLYREFLTLEPYANTTRDPVLFHQILKKLSCRHRGLNPRRTFCAIIFQLLFQPYYLDVIARTESCIREPKIRNQLLFHALYLSDDRVRLKILGIISQYVLRQQSTGSGSAENTMFRNSQNVLLSCVYRANIAFPVSLLYRTLEKFNDAFNFLLTSRLACVPIDHYCFSDVVVVVFVVFLTLTDPLRIQPRSQDRRNQTKSNRESEISMESRQKRTDTKLASKGHRHDKIENKNKNTQTVETN